MAQQRIQKRPTKKAKQLVKAYFPPSELPRLEKAAKKQGLSVSSFITSTILNVLAQHDLGA